MRGWLRITDGHMKLDGTDASLHRLRAGADWAWWLLLPGHPPKRLGTSLAKAKRIGIDEFHADLTAGGKGEAT